jgi:hypothetical protein
MSPRKVWFVDDLQSNLDAFKAAHDPPWRVETFLNPHDVLDRLRTETPDALFVDLFFYDTPEQAREVEEKVSQKATELRKFAQDIGAVNDRYLGGVRLIEEVAARFGKRFPVYAYTSKGPYLLEGSALDALARSDTPIVYKGRYSRAVEKLIVARDLRECEQRNSIKSRIARNLWPVLIGWGVVSWAVGKFLEYLWQLVT